MLFLKAVRDEWKMGLKEEEADMKDKKFAQNRKEKFRIDTCYYPSL